MKPRHFYCTKISALCDRISSIFISIVYGGKLRNTTISPNCNEIRIMVFLFLFHCCEDGNVRVVEVVEAGALSGLMLGNGAPGQRGRVHAADELLVTSL